MRIKCAARCRLDDAELRSQSLSDALLSCQHTNSDGGFKRPNPPRRRPGAPVGYWVLASRPGVILQGQATAREGPGDPGERP